MNGKTVLIVDDEIDIQSSLSFALKDEHFEVLTASSPKEAEALLAQTSVDVGLFDVWFPDGDGIDLLKFTREKFPAATVVMMSGHGNIELALKSIRLGAYDFLEKPLELEKVLVILRNAMEAQRLRTENSRLSEQLVGRNQLLGRSPALQNLKNAISRVAQAPSPVLIVGENGSGKELVARQLHQMGPRREKSFIGVNCAAIPEGLLESELFGHEKGAFTGALHRQMGRFEQAGEGTLFLDEISELTLNAQSKLLRVLEEKSYERVGGRHPIHSPARILAATNRDLGELIKKGAFREDLYYRLNVVTLQVPPLRERREDIPILAQNFLETLSKDYSRAVPELKAELLRWFESYEWPGNVRELRNLIERMLIMAPSEEKFLGLSDLPEELQVQAASLVSSGALGHIQDPSGSIRDLRAQFEKNILLQRLEKMGGNVTRTAESLGIERAHLHRKMKQYGISSKGESQA